MSLGEGGSDRAGLGLHIRWTPSRAGVCCGSPAAALARSARQTADAQIISSRLASSDGRAAPRQPTARRADMLLPPQKNRTGKRQGGSWPWSQKYAGTKKQRNTTFDSICSRYWQRQRGRSISLGEMDPLAGREIAPRASNQAGTTGTGAGTDGDCAAWLVHARPRSGQTTEDTLEGRM